MLAQLESSTRLEGRGGEEGELACALLTHSRSGEAVTAAKQLRSRRLLLLQAEKGQPQ